LSDVEGERENLDLRDLPPATRDRYLDEWRQAGTRFVSDPRDATRAAERLVVRVLHERGYPESDDDGRLVSLVSADHPDIADRYRHGHAMLEGVVGAESTENLRKAMLDFRAVLEADAGNEKATLLLSTLLEKSGRDQELADVDRIVIRRHVERALALWAFDVW